MIKNLLFDIAKYSPTQIIPAIVGFLSIPVITRLFSPNDYGNYVLVVSIVNVLTIIVGWLTGSIVRFYPAYEKVNKLDILCTHIIKLTFISITILTVSFSIILLITESYISPDLYNLMFIGVLLFISTSIFLVLRQFLRAKRKVDSYSVFTISKTAGTIVIGLILILIFNFNISGLLWGGIFCTAVSIPLLWRKAKNGISLKSVKLSISVTLDLFKYGFPLVVGNLAAWILSLSDRYVIQFLRNSQEVGIYSASYDISAQSIILLATLFKLASGPIETNIWENYGPENAKYFLNKLARYYILICLPAAVGLSVLAKPTIAFLTPLEYHEGYRIVPFVAFGGLLYGLQQIFDSGLAFYKKTFSIMTAILISGGINLSLNFVLIHFYGYIGAAFATLSAYSFLLIAIIRASRKYFIWEFPFKSLLKASIASIAMAPIVFFISRNISSLNIVNLFLAIVVGVVVYFIVLIITREATEYEIQFLNKFVVKLIKQKL